MVKKQASDDMPDGARQGKSGQGVREPQKVGPDNVVLVRTTETRGHLDRQQRETAHEGGTQQIGYPYG